MAITMTNALPQLGPMAKPYPFLKSTASEEPVRVVGDSVVFSPKDMEIDKFYLAQLGDSPYIYRRTGEGEVEVYGLAD